MEHLRCALLEQPPCGLVCFTKCFAVFCGHELERRRIGSDPIAAVAWRACFDKQGVEARLAAADPTAAAAAEADRQALLATQGDDPNAVEQKVDLIRKNT